MQSEIVTRGEKKIYIIQQIVKVCVVCVLHGTHNWPWLTLHFACHSYYQHCKVPYSSPLSPPGDPFCMSLLYCPNCASSYEFSLNIFGITRRDTLSHPMTACQWQVSKWTTFNSKQCLVLASPQNCTGAKIVCFSSGLASGCSRNWLQADNNCVQVVQEQC